MHQTTQTSSATLSDDGQSLLTLAFIFWQHHKHARALAILEGLRHLEPHSTAYLPLLCAVYVDNALYEEALQIGLPLLENSQGQAHLSAAQLCATALWKSQKQEEATALLQQALEKYHAHQKS